MSRERMAGLWASFGLDQDQFRLLQTLSSAFGLWYPEGEGYVIPTLMRTEPPAAALHQVALLKGFSEENELLFHALPANEYQIIMKFSFPRDMPAGNYTT